MPEVLWCKRLACFFWQPGWLRKKCSRDGCTTTGRSILVVNVRERCILRVSIKGNGYLIHEPLSG